MTPDIEDLLSRMTLEEKVSLLSGADLWHSVAIPRLGIPAFKMSDGPNGARGAEGGMGASSACFPAGIALGATWNPALVEQVGQALAAEVRAKGADMLLAPTVNIHRSPLSGRNFEFYAEDPFLSGTLAAAYIRGLQSQGVGACIKHFVCNDSEFERTTMSSQVAERPLREIYLLPFEIAVAQAHPWAVMSSYNKINGVSASENDPLLRGILKGEWGFDGLVMSDWDGAYSPAVSGSGLDLEMPGPAKWMGKHALQAVRSGQLSEAVIDDKVRRLLRTLQRVGRFEQPELQPEQAVDLPAHRRLIRQAAGEAAVLLKNESALPLQPAGLHSLAIIGSPAQQALVIGGGSAFVKPHYVVSPLEAIRQRVGAGLEVGYALGCPIHRFIPLLDPAQVGGGMRVELFDNLDCSGAPADVQFFNRLQIEWSNRILAKVNPQRFSARLSATFTAPRPGTYAFSLVGSGRYRLLLDGAVVADGWSSGYLGGLAWGSGETTGERNGSLELQAGQTCALTVEFALQSAFAWRNLRIGCLLPVPADPLGEAVELARRSEVAIVFAGTGDEWESEGIDRLDMDLPAGQNELIERVAAANPNTIVVLTTGSPMRMPWLGSVRAVLQAWFAGQEAGNAITDVLFGDVCPSGRLPQTFPQRLEDNPAYINYPGENGQVLYGEGLFVGYRYYDKKDVDPLFPFGFGLSYTSFAYYNLTLDAAVYRAGQPVQVSVEVENTGAVAGQEVVQLYVSDLRSSLARPLQELKAFAKITLAPGERQVVHFSLDERALAFYNPAVPGWVAEPGMFEVRVGSSSRHIHQTAQFELK